MKKLRTLDPEEREQIKNMLSEKKGDSSKSEKLGWMYQDGKPETEEYLLGRRVDKFIDNEKDEKAEAERSAPGAIFSEVMARRADLDMQTKMREDPLYAIRKKEEEARRRLLANPIKMKQLQKELDKKSEEAKMKKKKKKKHKKKHSTHSDSDSDDELIKKYLTILEKKKSKSKLSEAGSSQDSDKESMQRKAHKKGGRPPGNSDSSSSESSDERSARKKRQLGASVKPVSDDDNEDRGHRKAYGLQIKGDRRGTSRKRSKSISPVRSRSNSPRHTFSSWDSKSGSRSYTRKRSKSPKRKRSRSPVGRKSEGKHRSRSRSPSKDRYKKSQAKRDPPRKKMDEETLKRLRDEMMNDATWRNEQRATNIEKYKKQDEKEREKLRKGEGKEASFLKPIMADHAAQSSVEDRLKRNRYHIQRTKVQIDKNFTKQ